ncbi:hypothetical protein HID58_078830 [Brassica napus]|uniref:C-CAP/cofactor C-like domain-containing protein n=2 Tax=Brassica napus TaxID=3708 RepID=A0ABQ7YV54_BRANA|nr:hypothetical protein HID58_078830 [Brassica napus]CDY63924.1 BnaC07g51300D [Brassica napus]
MEDEDPRSETVDEALQKKHHDMLERFSARHQARKSDSASSSSSSSTSRPIIEDSSGVRFGPYCLGYGGIEEDLKTAGLEEETESWANVDDFLWLRAVHSPNWSLLPQEERLSSVSISGEGDS